MGRKETAVALLLAVWLLAGNPAGSVPARAQAPTPSTVSASPALAHTVVVIGQGTIEAAPDQALVTVGAQVTRASAQEAQAQASTVMNRIVQQIMALGIPRERLQTVEISLFPQRQPNSNQISGYSAVQRILATVDDLNLVGRVLDAAAGAGANLMDGVSFTLRDPTAARARALAAAVQEARATASTLAGAAGISGLRLVHLEEVGAGPAPRVVRQAKAEASTPVLGGTLSINEQVRAVFAF
jgi:uncharacterized protein YggE